MLCAWCLPLQKGWWLAFNSSVVRLCQGAPASLDLFAAAGARREGLVWWQERRQRKAPCLYIDAITLSLNAHPPSRRTSGDLQKFIKSSARVPLCGGAAVGLQAEIVFGVCVPPPFSEV